MTKEVYIPKEMFKFNKTTYEIFGRTWFWTNDYARLKKEDRPETHIKLLSEHKFPLQLQIKQENKECILYIEKSETQHSKYMICEIKIEGE